MTTAIDDIAGTNPDNVVSANEGNKDTTTTTTRNIRSSSMPDLPDITNPLDGDNSLDGSDDDDGNLMIPSSPAEGSGGGARRRRWRSEPFGLTAYDQSVRHVIKFSNRTFDVQKELPEDMQRVYSHLKDRVDEEYALTFVFIMRTAIELHRAWHMTLLTNKLLLEIKQQFNMRMTWNLGVLRLVFRVEDGGYELHRNVPYDYDSEFQDLYMKIAVALIEGHITIHEALLFQSETKRGEHTAPSGLFLRNPPGRLLLYPLQASTCAVIFFEGDGYDAAVAAICGFSAGLVEWALSSIGKEGSKTRGEAKILIDIFVGLSTGIIASIFYKYWWESNDICMSSIFLGTLYWFFYGTAFVIGILEIIAGELVTGVTRFIAVSVKTFVLCLGASFGMLLMLPNTHQDWIDSAENCGTLELSKGTWWRIPLYLASSASALGQYRVPLGDYWRGLIVQLAGYEVQYQTAIVFAKRFEPDTGEEQSNLDAAASNVLGAMAAVMAAYILRRIVDRLRSHYYARILQRHGGIKNTCCGDFWFHVIAFFFRVENCIGIGRQTDLVSLELQHKLREYKAELLDPNHPRQEIKLSKHEEMAIVQTIVSAGSLNMWALLMPAIYQLVPGSVIARFWFNMIFPPPNDEDNPAQDDVFASLMVVSTSLALGIILGFALFRALEYGCWRSLFCIHCLGDNSDMHDAARQRERDIEGGMYTVPANQEEAPQQNNDVNNKGDGGDEDDGSGAVLVEMSNHVEETAASIRRDNGGRVGSFQSSVRSC